ncbi:MAG: beta-propeller fold lactonase family protein [Verrucomicrobiales bacterium]
MKRRSHRRRHPTFLLICAALLNAGWAGASLAGEPPLIGYVGTYTSPLKNMRKTQVDLPPGNGRGIHLFTIDRMTGAMEPAGVVEMGTSPSALAFNAGKTRLYSANETERLGDIEAGSVSAFAIDPASGALTLLNTVELRGQRTRPPERASIRQVRPRRELLRRLGRRVAGRCRRRLGKATDVQVDEGEIGRRKPRMRRRVASPSAGTTRPTPT